MVKDWSTKDKDALYDWLSGMLRTSNVTITFEKKDGSTRVMNATLNESIVPKYEKKTDKEKVKSKDILAVFDLDKNVIGSRRKEQFQGVTSVAFDVIKNGNDDIAGKINIRLRKIVRYPVYSIHFGN